MALSGFSDATIGSPPPSHPAQALLILKKNCFSCHNDEKQKGGLILTSREHMLRGSDNGPVIASQPDQESSLVRVLIPDSDPHMPPKKQLTDQEIDAVKSWIAAGLPWDESLLASETDLLSIDQLKPLPGSYQPALALALAPNGNLLAANRGADLHLLDVSAPEPKSIQKLSAGRDSVQSLAWSSDGKTLAIGEFRRVRIIQPADPDAAAEVTNLVGRVTALAFVAENSKLLIADNAPPNGGWIRVWSVENRSFVTNWLAHRDTIYDLSLTADGKRLATAGADKLIKIWDWQSAQLQATLEGHSAYILALAFTSRTNGTFLASAGADKEIKIWDVATRDQKHSVAGHPVPIVDLAWADDGKIISASEDGVIRLSNMERDDPERTVASITNMLTAAVLAPDGKTIYATAFDGSILAWDREGKIKFKLSSAELAASSKRPAPSETGSGAQSSPDRVSFLGDILPVLSKAGCNAGKCHAKPEGQNGFKLSVFAYDPKSDYREITQDARGRRVFPAYPEESLLLKKPTATVEHEGGERFAAGSKPYELLKRWIEAGMPYANPDEPVLLGIRVTPSEGTYTKESQQTLSVEAAYSNGVSRNVTEWTEFESSEKEIAKVDDAGRVTVGRFTGETIIIARFMGTVATSRITVPGDRQLPDHLYAKLPVNNFIDELAYVRFRKLGLLPSDRCTDAEFLRRVSLDLIGTLPKPSQAREFIADTDPHKRARLVDRLLEHPSYGDHWAGKWADLVRPNPDRVGVKSVYMLDQWLRDSFRQNKPFNEFTREILTAQGSTHEYGPTVIFRDRREPADITTMVSQIFLGVRLECAKCHHHPNEKWSQDDFYQFAAFFGEVKRKGTGISPPISGDYEVIYHSPGGHVSHPLTGATMKPKPPDGPLTTIPDGTDPRRVLADWVCQPDNPFFSRAIVNRIWAELFGRGMVDPVDDFRTSNPPSNEALLGALAEDFAKHNFDLKHLMRRIVTSHLYQLSSLPNPYNAGDTRNFSRSYRRRLPAEVLMDAVTDITGAPPTFQGMPPGARAKTTWSYKINSEFLDAFGRPNSSSDCPCERDMRTSVVQALHLMNSNDLQARITHPDGQAARLAASERSPQEIITELYLATYNRFPEPEELRLASEAFSATDATRASATEDVMWALINSAEFVFNH